jgi:hypothetical protein
MGGLRYRVAVTLFDDQSSTSNIPLIANQVKSDPGASLR